jgi:hypothetical protein
LLLPSVTPPIAFNALGEAFVFSRFEGFVSLSGDDAVGERTFDPSRPALSEDFLAPVRAEDMLEENPLSCDVLGLFLIEGAGLDPVSQLLTQVGLEVS